MATSADNLLAGTEAVADEVAAMHSIEPKETSSAVKAPDLASSVTDEKHVTDSVADTASEVIGVSVAKVTDGRPDVTDGRLDVADERPEAENEAESAKIAVAVDEIPEAKQETAPVVSEKVQHPETESEEPMTNADTNAGKVAVPEPADAGAQSESAVVDAAKSSAASPDDQLGSDAKQPIPNSTKPTGEDDPGNKKDGKEDEEVPYERPRVQVYGSTVSGNRAYKRQAKELFTMLEAQEVDFEFICIAADEQAKKYLRRKALGNMTIPQVYVDGELRGFYDDAFKANEADELYEWLGLDEEPVDY
ncbi:hypothetical protein IWW37_002089 [Coemansia sp. RSA 2050]|nr:hypothetical protein IWW37_002089 [Coemansia sp. RSA 2050]KAJ2735998.1 hypothetical protein IW152_001121 [Coemansia sp. BCRC 34962]